MGTSVIRGTWKGNPASELMTAYAKRTPTAAGTSLHLRQPQMQVLPRPQLLKTPAW